VDRFDCLVRQYSNELKAVCYNVCRGRYELDDAFQEALIYLHTKFKEEIEDENFLEWAEAKIFNYTRNLVKRKPKLYDEDGKLIKNYNKQPDILYHHTIFDWALRARNPASRKENRLQLYKALDSLPSMYKQAIYLVIIQEMTIKGASEYLDITENCLRQRLYRAKEMLRVLIC
jgi:RNA polymerase sigma factor (sigma-70 family)